MSKLYDVINKLDDMAAILEEDNALAQIPYPVEREKPRLPLMRILLICGSLVALGLGCLAVVWWLQSESLPVRHEDRTQQMAGGARDGAVEAMTPGLEVTSSPALPPGEVVVPSTVDSAFAASTLPEIFVDVEREDAADDSTITIHPARYVEPVMEPRPLDSAILATEIEEHLDTAVVEPAAQLSRWLQQAESLRRNGEWESASALFAKIYERSGSPAVANNLAATLIRLERYGEARDVLVEALAKTPGDLDLQKNYQLIQQLVKAGRL